MTKRFFKVILLVFLIGCQPGPGAVISSGTASGPRVSILGQRQYTVLQEFTLYNEGPGQPEKQNIWVALIRDFPPYQAVQSMVISPRGYTSITDEVGNQYAEFDFSGQPASSKRTVRIDYRVTVSDIAYDLSGCEGDLPDDFTRPELHIESANPQIVALAENLSRNQETVCQQVRAFYDYTAGRLSYAMNGENWGAQAALGPMGADCTEYASLLAALSRAQGIPARYFEGLLITDQGENGGSAVEHAWPDVYLPSTGWTALDPTLGRVPADRDTYFARYTADHIIVTLGASPSVLRGSSYWTHLYWPGDTTRIRVSGEWTIDRVDPAGGN